MSLLVIEYQRLQGRVKALENVNKELLAALEDSCCCPYCSEHGMQACAGCNCGYDDRREAAINNAKENI